MLLTLLCDAQADSRCRCCVCMRQSSLQLLLRRRGECCFCRRQLELWKAPRCRGRALRAPTHGGTAHTAGSASDLSTHQSQTSEQLSPDAIALLALSSLHLPLLSVAVLQGSLARSICPSLCSFVLLRLSRRPHLFVVLRRSGWDWRKTTRPSTGVASADVHGRMVLHPFLVRRGSLLVPRFGCEAPRE